MNNSQESNYFIPLLSAIAGIGAIVTVLSPFLLNNDKVASLFIDSGAVQYASILAIILSVITIWYASSNLSYEVFQSGKGTLFKLILSITFLSVFFYALKSIALNNIFNKDLASILQLGSYIFGYLLLGSIVGILLRDNFSGYRYQKLQQEKFDRLREALFKSGLLKAELEIISFIPRPYNSNEGYFGAHNVIFKTSEGKFFAIVSSEYNQIIHSEEIKESKQKKGKN